MHTPQQTKPSILMLPWLAHGHISSYFELAKKLSENNFHIYFCSTPINLQFINQTLQENKLSSPSSSSIQLIELQLPYNLFPELHPLNLTTKNLPRQLIPTLVAAFDAAKPSFCSILETLKPTIVVYDILQPWAAEAALEHDIAAVLFSSSSAANSCFLFHRCLCPTTTLKLPFPEFDDFSETESQEFNQFLNATANGIKNKDRGLRAAELSSNLVLVKTSRVMESKYLDYFSSLIGKQVFPVGTLVQDPTYYHYKDNDTIIVDWLSKKEPASVVFVAFGSEYFLSREEMNEIANGLLLSKVCFIWVVRIHPEEKITVGEALPEGFSEEIEGKGMIVEGWAPQDKILRHPSIGGFVSHCGWGSTVEGIISGVPIIAIPKVVDQLVNAKHLVDLGVGMEVPRDKTDHQRVTREEVARVIKEVVVQEEGEHIRKKAKEMSGRMKKKGDTEMDLAVEKLMQLVK